MFRPLKSFLSLFVMTAIVAFQLHGLSHISHHETANKGIVQLAQDLSANCELCEVRSHTPVLKTSHASLLAEYFIAATLAKSPAANFNSQTKVQLPYSRGPPYLASTI